VIIIFSCDKDREPRRDRSVAALLQRSSTEAPAVAPVAPAPVAVVA